ncbi:IS110 family transposase [Lentzea californiensis]|uniref:IS110 family transposase n=1 Tax=Lentzea californiensis TaxID=438851 RepID=UPI00216631EA|nr:IS110 family transposase [Lentzea californiensis]
MDRGGVVAQEGFAQLEVALPSSPPVPGWQGDDMSPVIIGVDPHKRSATIEIVDGREHTLGQGRFGTDNDGYRRMLEEGRRRPDRVWAVEGCNGVGKHLAQRLVADGEPVLDVPAKLAARARVFDTGHGRKTDATDARSVALVALRTTGLHRVSPDDHTVALRLLVDRRDELGRARTDTVNRLHKLLTELIPGGAKKFLSATQARALLATVRPRDVVGRTRRRLAAELITDLATIDRKMTAADTQLTELLDATGTGLRALYGIGPSSAARILGDVGDVGRFPDRGRFASWNGTAPIDASSGEHQRHRLSRAGNRRINRVLHIMAIVQLRNDTPGRAYYRRKLADGKSPREAIRCLKRRLSDTVYKRLVTDAKIHTVSTVEPSSSCLLT